VFKTNSKRFGVSNGEWPKQINWQVFNELECLSNQRTILKEANLLKASFRPGKVDRWVSSAGKRCK